MILKEKHSNKSSNPKILINTEQIEELNILIDYLHHRAGKLEIRLPDEASKDDQKARDKLIQGGIIYFKSNGILKAQFWKNDFINQTVRQNLRLFPISNRHLAACLN
ncbi:MAG: hypothetical protein HWD63_01930 [Candidatus Parvibacillus calidus]|nr:MAG: hypothetical protein HWD63_01930 [Candidatus Parvibacillus calidus]